MKDFIKINENDNVIVAIKELAEGEKVTVDGKEYTAAETIPAGHKMAICDIPQGGDVIKYGFRIGNAKENIKAGQWVHVHNIKTALGDLLTYTYEPVKNRGEKDRGAYLYGICTPGWKCRCTQRSLDRTDCWLCEQHRHSDGKTCQRKGTWLCGGSDCIPASIWMFPDG